MRHALFPALRGHLSPRGRRRELSPAWHQAFILASLVLFVLAAASPSDAGAGGTPAPGIAAGSGEGKEACLLDGDLVQFVEGIGFAIGGCPGEQGSHSRMRNLSEPF